MSRADGWTMSPELSAPTDLGGPRFTDPDIERDYHRWRTEHGPEEQPLALPE